MVRKILALIGLFVALTTAAALAQEEPTYEGRGYGGPLGVGPNFQHGGQWGPPIYDGSGAREHSSTRERYREGQRHDRVERKRSNDDDDVKTAKKALATEKAKEAKAQNENSSIVTIGPEKSDVAKSDLSKTSNENSTIASVASGTTANADPIKGELRKRVDTDATGNTVETCKRYFPTVGQTITVPCD